MTEASKDVNISHHAALLAKEKNFEVSEVEGTGREGMITKADIELAIKNTPQPPTPEVKVPAVDYSQIDKNIADLAEVAEVADEGVGASPSTPPIVGGYTNIMDAQAAARRKAEGKAPDAPSDAGIIQTATNEDLIALVQSMRGELDSLKEATAGLIDRDTYATDLTDEMFYIAKPGGQKWEERRVRDKRTVLVEFVGTAFFGPFPDNKMIETYLKEKSRKREDSYLEWESISVMTGKQARTLDRQEKADREAVYQSDVSTNILDRRIWDQTSVRDPDASVAEVIGPAA